MAKSKASLRRTQVRNLNRAELYRELARSARETNVSAAARKARIPRSTLAAWLKKRRVPDRVKSIKRARRSVEYLRKKKKAPPPRPVDQRDQQSVIFWAFASGPGVVPMAAAKLARLAQAVAAGEAVTSAQAFVGKLETVRARAFDAYRQSPQPESHRKFVHKIEEEESTRDRTAAQNAGDAFRKKFAMSSDGQQNLSDAFIRELIWLMEYSEVGLAVMPSEELDALGVVEERPKGRTFTNSMANIWSLYNYCLPLPPFGIEIDSPGFVIAYDPSANDPDVYEVSVWLVSL